jgi:uncharacterized membrane protein YeaQ/YmgE (transglycosylase-associated protein family)
MTLGNFVVWLIIGALAGSLVGMIIERKKKGYGRIQNLGIGMAGSVIGGFLFRLFRIDFGWGQLSVSLEDVIAAVFGSLILLIIIWIIGKRRTKS